MSAIRMKALLLSVTAATALSLSSVGANLLVNGGAELGNVPNSPSGYGPPVGWTTSNPEPYAYPFQDQSTGRVYPKEGSYLFSYCWNAPSLWMSQSGSVGLDQPALQLTGWVQMENLGSPPDTGEAVLRISDGSDNVLASVSSGTLTSQTFVWEPFALTLDVPGNAAKWTVEFTGTLHYGSYVNVYFDGLDLEAVPEPTLLSLLTLGGVVALRRRSDRR